MCSCMFFTWGSENKPELPHIHLTSKMTSLRYLLHPKTIHLSFSLPQSWSPLHAVIYFLLLSLTSTPRVLNSPSGSNIRHAKVKSPDCHLAWLNVYQSRLHALTYGLEMWHPWRLRVCIFISMCVCDTENFLGYFCCHLSPLRFMEKEHTHSKGGNAILCNLPPV